MRFIYLPFILVLVQCTMDSIADVKESFTPNGTLQAVVEHVSSSENTIATDNYKCVEIQCDSIYFDRNIILQLWTTVKHTEYDRPNSEFVFLKDGKIIYRDSVFSFVQQIEFKDYNLDGVKDILIQEYSDVRSNWTYNLYLIDNISYAPIHISEFSQLTNPTLNAMGDTINSYTISSTVYHEQWLLTNSKQLIQVSETEISKDLK